MKCKFKQLEEAMSHFRYSLPSDSETEVEISTREESFENDVIMSCVVMTVTYKKPPSNYEGNIGVKTISRTIEVFPESENRNPIVTHQETYELLNKKN